MLTSLRSFLKSLSKDTYKLLQASLSASRLIFRTAVVPMMTSLWPWRRLLLGMIAFTCTLTLGAMIQQFFLTLYDFSSLHVLAYTCCLITSLWLLVVLVGMTNAAHLT